MTRLFAVTRSRGPGWDASRPLEGQDGWRSHADFMNALQAERFVLLGGPLEGTAETLLIIRAEDPDQISTRLAGDPWTGTDLLRTAKIVPWMLRLGSLGP